MGLYIFLEHCGKTAKEFCMKNTIKFLGIIAIVAIIGFSMAGCPAEEEEEPSLDGTG
jgi:hypothetical protein